jgi:hypothetical protein
MEASRPSFNLLRIEGRAFWPYRMAPMMALCDNPNPSTIAALRHAAEATGFSANLMPDMSLLYGAVKRKDKKIAGP